MSRGKVTTTKPATPVRHRTGGRPRIMGDLLDPAKEEVAWKKMLLEVDLVQAFRFWNGHLQLRSGGITQPSPLSAEETSCFLLLIRAMSWVESRHGTGTGYSPKQDPMQCANPADLWWQQISGVIPKGDRLIGGPGGPNYYPSEIPAKINAGLAKLPGLENASTDLLSSIVKGHKDPGFNSVMSYFWAIPVVVHKTNASNPPGRKTYQCHPVDLAGLVRGAKNYNGGGNPNYADEVKAVLGMLNYADPLMANGTALSPSEECIGFSSWSPGFISLPFKNIGAKLSSPTGQAHAEIAGMAGGFGLRVPSTGYTLEFTRAVNSVTVDCVARASSVLSVEIFDLAGKLIYRRSCSHSQIVNYETEAAKIGMVRFASNNEAIVQMMCFGRRGRKSFG